MIIERSSICHKASEWVKNINNNEKQLLFQDFDSDRIRYLIIYLFQITQNVNIHRNYINTWYLKFSKWFVLHTNC